jgi:hypothetical protein
MLHLLNLLQTQRAALQSCARLCTVTAATLRAAVPLCCAAGYCYLLAAATLQTYASLAYTTVPVSSDYQVYDVLCTMCTLLHQRFCHQSSVHVATTAHRPLNA